MFEYFLPKGFALTPDLIVGEMISSDELTRTYRSYDRSFNADVILYEYFPRKLAIRNNDNSVAPDAGYSVELLPKHPIRPIISLSSKVTVRGIPGGDTSTTGLLSGDLDDSWRRPTCWPSLIIRI